MAHVPERSYIIRDPFLLHREGVRRSKGVNVFEANVDIAKMIADFLRSSLGPTGMSKLMMDKFGEMAVTSDGAKILEMMDMYHPTAKLLREAAKTVETVSGDGTKTTIILIGELVRRARGLVNHKVHVSSIIEGYRRAYQVALRRLRELSKPLALDDPMMIRRIIASMFIARGLSASAEHLSDLVVRAFQITAERRNGRIVFDGDLVKIVKKPGRSLLESELVRGVVINRRAAHPSMPKLIRNARVAVLDLALKIDPFRRLQPYKEEIVIQDARLVREFLKEERRMIEEMVKRIREVGAGAVFCRKRIGRFAGSLLAEAGILAAGRLLKEEDIALVARATGAKRVADLDDLKEEDLGWAELVEERKMGDERVIVIEGGGSKVVTIILRASSPQQLDEAEHAVKDSLTVLASLAENPAYLPGGGATELALAIAVREESLKHGGREQVAMHAFANSLEVIPSLLARNCGADPIDVLTELRSKHVAGRHEFGVDARSGRVVDVYEAGIVDPAPVKEQVLKTAFEVASTILKIDDIVDVRYAKRHRGELP